MLPGITATSPATIELRRSRMRKSILPFASKPSAREELMSSRMGASLHFPPVGVPSVVGGA